MIMNADNIESKLPHLCEQVLGQLAKDTGYDLLPDLLSTFIADIEQRFSTLKSETKKSAQWWQLQLHPLKSTSATYGALKLNSLTKSLESLCHQQVELDCCQGEVFDSLVSELINELAAVLTHYRQCLEQLKSKSSVICAERATN